jgi:ribonuclease P protein component
VPKVEKDLQFLVVVSKPLQIKKTSTYQNIAASRNRKKLCDWLYVQYLSSEDQKNHFGTIASKKVGNAVVRNKLKRWVRSCVRSEKWPVKFDQHFVVFVFKQQTNSEFFSKLKYSEFLAVFKKV